MARIFISSDSEDENRANELRSALVERGHTAFSVDATVHGAKWYSQVEADLEESDAVVVIVGSNTSEWQESEIQQALEKSWQRPETKIVPVVFGHHEVPSALRDFQANVVEPEAGNWTADVVQAVESPSTAIDQDLAPEDRARLASKNSTLRSWVDEQRKTYRK